VFRGHHRKVRLLFAISDVLLTALAFALAYQARVMLAGRAPALGHEFFLTRQVVVLLLGWSIVVWVAVASWWEIYDRIDAAHPRAIRCALLANCRSCCGSM
jgi:hypothetical protein